MRIRLAGHPAHPALVHFPIALWTVAIGAEAAGWISGQPVWWQFGFACQALGVIAGLFALATGFLDFTAIARGDPARDTGVAHMLAIALAWMLFLVSLALRGLPPGEAPSFGATAAVIAGFVAMSAGGWLGGRLVYHFGVGVTNARQRRE